MIHNSATAAKPSLAMRAGKLSHARGAEEGCCAQDVEECSELIAIALFLALTLGRLNADLLVVLLQSRKVLACLRELALLHTLADIPMDKRALRVHQIKLVVDAREHLSNSSRVADHANRAHYLGKVATWYHSRRLVVDAALEASRRPSQWCRGTFDAWSGYRPERAYR